MLIKMLGNLAVDAPRDYVWNSIFDLEVMKGILSRVSGIDIEQLVQIDEMHYEGAATLGVAIVKGKYSGTITILDKRASEFLKIKGEGKGGGNYTSGEMGLMLTEQDAKTSISYWVQGNLGGPLASVGQRLVDTVGQQLVQQVTKVLAEEITARYRAQIAKK